MSRFIGYSSWIAVVLSTFTIRYFASSFSPTVTTTIKNDWSMYNQYHCNLNSILYFSRPPRRKTGNENLALSIKRNVDIDDPLERTKRQLEKLKQMDTALQTDDESNEDGDHHTAEKKALYQQLILQPANKIKLELQSRKLNSKGRKPDLAQRLVDHIIQQKYNDSKDGEDEEEEIIPASEWVDTSEDDNKQRVDTFGTLKLSNAASNALTRAQFTSPTPIQSKALPLMVNGEDVILHAETGSGKTLCYLLPITERLWNNMNEFEEEGQYGLILTPTRELAAQVAGIASVLAPPNSVRLITTPTNLVRESFASKERGESDFGGRIESSSSSSVAAVGTEQIKARLIVGSAKSIYKSLFGDASMPAPPTSKPEAKAFLKGVRYLVLDEVDRLLNVKPSRGSTSKYYKKHDKPAAILTSSITRLTLSQAQIVAASATVGRPLKREMARVLGLLPSECPPVIRGATATSPSQNVAGDIRAVTIPSTVQHYVMPCDGQTSGSLLTAAAFLIKGLKPIPIETTESTSFRGRRILFVLTNACGLNAQNTIGALRHFRVEPEPKVLLDALEADGTDRLMEIHREVSGSRGVGESVALSKEGYVLVTGEDSVRGLHLDELDTVVVVGRPKGPDEYTHIAGRTGRAGKKGSVVNVVSYEQGAALTSWERMLNVDFIPLDEGEASTVD